MIVVDALSRRLDLKDSKEVTVSSEYTALNQLSLYSLDLVDQIQLYLEKGQLLDDLTDTKLIQDQAVEFRFEEEL